MESTQCVLRNQDLKKAFRVILWRGSNRLEFVDHIITGSTSSGEPRVVRGDFVVELRGFKPMAMSVR
jgi:hypothetical protein